MSDDQVNDTPTEEAANPVEEANVTDEAEDIIIEADADEEAEALSPEEQLAALEAQAADYLDGWQRARAELQNVKKRTERERQRLEENLRGDLALSLLPVVDDFDRAVGNLPDDLADHEWVSGLLLIYKKLGTQLHEMGIEEIEAEGQPFDPALHEAVAQIASDEHEPDTVVAVLRKGYRLDDKVIRAALVHVAQ